MLLEILAGAMALFAGKKAREAKQKEDAEWKKLSDEEKASRNREGRRLYRPGGPVL